MRTLLAVLVFAAACGKGKPTSEKTGSGSASGSSPVVMENTQAPDVTLPPSTGTPPNKDKDLDAATLKKLSEMTFPSWTSKPLEVTEKAAILRQVTSTAPKISVTVLVRSCAVAKNCIPMELDKWKADEKFKDTMLGGLKEAKDTVFELSTADLNGQPMIASYILGQNFSIDDKGNTPGSYKYTYGLHYNDGTNQIQVIAGYADVPVKTKEDMQATIPRGDLEKTARAFMDAYTHAW